MPAFHWLQSPLFAAQSDTVANFQLYYGPDEWGNSSAPLHLLVKSAGVWTTVQSWTSVETNLYESQIILPLADYAGQTIRIAWVYDLTGSGSAAVALDDLLIQNDP
jgi:hypothetical protein